MGNSDRTFIKGVFQELHLSNKFTIRSVGFEGTLRKVVTIKGWEPNPVAECVEKRLRGRGYLVVFTTTQGIQS